MTLKDDISDDVAANMYNATENPYAYAATFYPSTGISISMIVCLIEQDAVQVDGYETEIMDGEILIEYSRADLDRDVHQGERFVIGSRTYIVKGIRERDRFSRVAIVK